MSSFEKLLKTMLTPSVSAVYLIFTVLSFFYFDKPVAYYCHHLNLNAHFPVLHWLTLSAVGLIYMIFFLLLALFFRYVVCNKKWEQRSWLLWFTVLVPNLISLFLKIILGRARPQLLFDDHLYGFYGLHFEKSFWSFPSGHTTTIVGLMLGLIILFPRRIYWFIALALLVVSTRVLLTNHYLSDVMATAYLVLLEVGLLWFYIKRKHCLQALSN